jgi:mannose-6-phosphate isomerase
MLAPTQLYPYLLEPQEKSAIWGGDALVERYGKHAERGATIGESWECWDANSVDNGPLAGATLGEVRARLGSALMGPLDSRAIFPILTKIIDARQALSVQVHPDDAYAQRVEHQVNGKTECWFIFAAQPGAELILGWARDTDRAEYERCVADGSLGKLLRRVPVHAGEVFYLPAGTLHAIGAGIQLFEAQQASDLTYRIFDWNRVDDHGQPRELHVAKAGDVLDFRADAHGAVAPLSFHEAGCERTLLVAARRFSLERLRMGSAGGSVPTHGSPFTLTALATPLEVEIETVRAAVDAYATIVAPAGAANLGVVSAGEMLVVRPEPALDRMRADAVRAGIARADADAFFAQFA